MLVKIRTAFALALILPLTPAVAAPYVIDVPGPSVVVLETTVGLAPDLRDDPGQTLHPIVLEASPSHLVLAVGGPATLVVDALDGGEVVATITRVRLSEHGIHLPTGGLAVARSLFAAAFDTKEEDHDIDPDPLRTTGRPLLTLLILDAAGFLKEEDHDIDPDPMRGGLEAASDGDWARVSAAIAELGPGWYFAIRGGAVSYEVVVEAR
jgi:hypothetical protein